MKVVEYLVKKGIAPSVADAVGLSPLHWAAFSGHVCFIAHETVLRYFDSKHCV